MVDIDKLLNKMEALFYGLGKKHFLEQVTNKIGVVVEDDEKIVCYVNQNLLDKYGKELFLYRLSLDGINTSLVSYKRSVNFYDLDKPFYYVFDGIEFAQRVYFSSSAATVIFKNCVFKGDVGIHFTENVIFENNKYVGNAPMREDWHCYIYGSDNKNITFKNENIDKNHSSLENFGIDLKVDSLSIIDSNINIDRPGTVYIKAKDFLINNSNFDVCEFYLDSNNTKVVNSFINASVGAIIDNKFGDEFLVCAPDVFYNGFDLNDKDFDKLGSLEEHRKLLVGKLQDLRNYCNSINEEKLNNVKTELNNNSVSKVLKR